IHVTTLADNGDNSNPDPGSLRAAILAANANPGSTIVFNTDVKGTIDLLSALPDITADMNILGPAADMLTVERRSTLPDTDIFSGFNIHPASLGAPQDPVVTIAGLTVANFNDAGIVGGNLTLRQVVVSNNSFDALNTHVLEPGAAGGIIVGSSLALL